MEASDDFNSRPFSEIVTVLQFSSTVVKKYYDIENPKSN